MTSAYLKEPERLGDVIAAIQAMGLYKFYKLDFAGWAERLAADPSQADHWKQVFAEHPEFFRLNTEKDKASLVWRRQNRRRYDVDRRATLSEEEYDALTPKARKRVSRPALGAAEIGTLIQTAIHLHTSALEQKKETRWWVPLLAGLLGVVLGALLKGCA